MIGDRRKFVTALVVPNFEQLGAWAAAAGKDSSDRNALVSDPETVAFIMQQIDAVQQGVAAYEKIKRITLLPSHFSLEKGEVTNTMKVRRPVVAKNYSAQIEAMYAY